MATGIPVIATDWGGPADYLDQSCGILVPPRSREQFVGDLGCAMLSLAESPELRRRLGDAARGKVTREYDWERKVDRILSIFEDQVMAARCGREA
jgi:glycosyltransferase involved in cell wall biosynthesis